MCAQFHYRMLSYNMVNAVTQRLYNSSETVSCWCVHGFTVRSTYCAPLNSPLLTCNHPCRSTLNTPRIPYKRSAHVTMPTINNYDSDPSHY